MENTNHKYPALRFLSTLLRFCAWMILAATLLACLIALTKGGDFRFIITIAVLVIGGFLGVILFAIAESLVVLVDIEFNTRNAASNAMGEMHVITPSSESISQNIDDSIPANSMNGNSLTEQQLMDKFGITFDGENFHFREYKYQNLKDAVNYAKRQSSDV